MFKDKKVLTIILLSFVFVFGVIFYGYQTLTNAMGVFPQDGFILGENSSEIDGVVDDNYYFSAGDKYQNKYPNKVVFNNDDGQKVVAEVTNFVHFNNESLMALSDGVFLDTDKLDQSTLRYYNIGNKVILDKQQNDYLIHSQTNEEKIKNFVWKLSDSKYMIVSPSIEMNFSENNVAVVEDYVEVEFIDKGVVRLAHQDGNFQTISREAYLEMDNGVQLRLSDKTLLSGEEEIMTLAQMVIDADDNIEVIEKEIEVEEEKEDEEDDAVENPSENIPNQDVPSQNVPSGNNGNSNMGNDSNTPDVPEEDDNESNENDEELEGVPSIPEEDTTVEFPSFELTNFETSLISVLGTVEIKDNDGLLRNATNVKIVESGRGRVIYDNDFAEGAMSFEFGYEGLKPDTEYIVTISGDYEYNDEEYHKDFITKVFKTDDLGLSFKKGYVTSSTIGIEIQAQSYTMVNDAKLALYKYKNTNELEKIEDLEVSVSDAINQNGYIEEFVSLLDSNTDYVVRLEEIQYGNTLIQVENENVELKLKTLKKSPLIGESAVYVDEKLDTFRLYNERLMSDVNDENVISNATYQDVDNGIVRVAYEIYEKKTVSIDPETGKNIFTEKPIKTVEEKGIYDVVVEVDGRVLQPSVEYVYRQVVEFDDNEKIIVYTGNLVDLSLNHTTSFPIVEWFNSFDENGQAIELHDGIIGTVSIKDAQDIVENTPILISVKSGIDRTRTFMWQVDTTNSSWVEELANGYLVETHGLSADTYYRIEVYAQLTSNSNVCNEGEICSNYVYIGGEVVKTAKAPEVTMTITIPKINPLVSQEAFRFHVQLSDDMNGYAVKSINTLELQLHKEDIGNQLDPIGFVTIADSDEQNNEAINTNPSLYNHERNKVYKNFKLEYKTQYDSQHPDYVESDENEKRKVQFITDKEFNFDGHDAKYYTLRIHQADDYCYDYAVGKNESNALPIKVQVMDYNQTNPTLKELEKEEDGSYHVKIDTHGYIPEYEVNNSVFATPKMNQEYKDNLDIYRNDLDGGTVVRVEMSNGFPNNALRYAQSVTYTAWTYHGEAEGFKKYSEVTIERNPNESWKEIPSYTFEVLDGVSDLNLESEKENSKLYRGHTYYFTYSVKMNLTDSLENPLYVNYPQNATGYSSDEQFPDKDFLESLLQEDIQNNHLILSKQKPKVKMYIDSSDKDLNTVFNYEYSDVDHSIIDDILYHNDEVFNWTNGTFIRKMNQEEVNNLPNNKIEKNVELNWEIEDDPLELMRLDVDYVDSSEIENVSFDFKANDPVGKAVISLNGDENLLNRMTSLDLTFVYDGNKEINLNKDIQDGKVIFPLSELNELAGKNFKIEAIAHYDSGKMGIYKDDEFVMGTYIPSKNESYYASDMNHIHELNANGKLHKQFELNDDSVFTSSKIIAKQDNRNVEYDYLMDSQGFRLDVDGEDIVYLIPKKVETAIIQDISNDFHTFDYVYPEVKNVDVVAGLVDAKITFNYYGTHSSEIVEENGHRYIYLTLENMSTHEIKIYKQEITENVMNNSLVTFEIPENVDDENEYLSSATDYQFTLGVKLNKDDPNELYPLVDEKNEDGKYEFQTISEIQFKDDKVDYQFVNRNYDEKYLKFVYTPMSVPANGEESHVVSHGFKIRYTLKEVSTNRMIELGEFSERDSFMENFEQFFPLGSGEGSIGSQLSFNQEYELTLEPLLKTDDSPAGKKKSIRFTLNDLQEPLAREEIVPVGQGQLEFKWTLFDQDFSLVDSKYRVTIHEGLEDGKVIYSNEYIFYQKANENEEGQVLNDKLSGSVGLTQIEKYLGTSFKFKEGQDYTIVVKGKYDKSYQEPYGGSSIDWKSVKTMKAPNSEGIAIGDVMIEKINNNKGLQLVFSNSYGLSEKVKQIHFTILGSQTMSETILPIFNVKDNIVTVSLGDDLIQDLKSGVYDIAVVLRDEDGKDLAQLPQLRFNVSSRNLFENILDFLDYRRCINEKVR